MVVAGDRRAAVLVDELIAEQEVTVKSLGDRLRRIRGVSGATILPDGGIALVLNASTARPRLAGSERRPAGSSLASRRGGRGARARARAACLVVDDSVTIRTLEKDNLESAGYEVITAVDGEDGWRVLQQRGADLVVTDIEMPRMDGLRASPEAGLAASTRRFA